MLTRAYDAIMAALQVPMNIKSNVDFNNSAIDDGILNCKDCNGNICVIATPGYYNGTSMGAVGFYASTYPFAHFDVNSILPDEEESVPDYEDYSVPNRTPSGWTISSQYPSFSKSYDPETKEFVCSVAVLWQNTSGAAKTVYGVKVKCVNYYRPSYNQATTNDTKHFLLCREHFAAPVVVEDQGIISLTFTWRVGRAGLVSATAAAAK